MGAQEALPGLVHRPGERRARSPLISRAAGRPGQPLGQVVPAGQEHAHGIGRGPERQSRPRRRSLPLRDRGGGQARPLERVGRDLRRGHLIIIAAAGLHRKPGPARCGLAEGSDAAPLRVWQTLGTRLLSDTEQLKVTLGTAGRVEPGRAGPTRQCRAQSWAQTALTSV